MYLLLARLSMPHLRAIRLLEETAGVLKGIRSLEAKNKQTSLIERFKKGALEVNSAVQEVVQSRRSGSAETAINSA